jgi:hypothetical protein
MPVLILGGGNVDRIGRIAEPVDIANRFTRELGSVLISGRNTLIAGEKTVADLNIPESLAADVACHSVTVQAKAENTQSVYLGNANGQYFELPAGASISIPVNNLNLVFIKVQVNNEGVNYLGVA